MRLTLRQRSAGWAALITLALVAVATPQPALGQGDDVDGFVWTRQFGTSGGDFARNVAVDGSVVYVSGDTGGAFPGQASAGGLSDAFLRKYDSEGNEEWTRQFGSPDIDLSYGVALDASGIYIAGTASEALPGQVSLGQDAFVRKYGADGTEIWTRQFGSPAHDSGWDVAVDASGVYVVGDTGNGGALPGQENAGGTDVFVRKYDADGNELWTRQFGTSAGDSARGVATDVSGVHVAGTVGNASSLPGQTNKGYTDAFVRKYDPDGNEIWTRQFGTSSSDFTHGVVVDASGIYIAGWTEGAFPETASAGGLDVFVRKYDENGNEVWTRQFGTAGSDSAQDLAVNTSGVYVVGNAGGALLRKYDAEGNEGWTRRFGSPDISVSGVASDASGIYLAGTVGDALPGQVSAGGTDAFVVKIAQAPPPATSSWIPYAIVAVVGAGAAVAVLLWKRLHRSRSPPPSS